ncbi:hypothetical protein HGM15179_002220, partial [Zosterops borbonicus]
VMARERNALPAETSDGNIGRNLGQWNTKLSQGSLMGEKDQAEWQIPHTSAVLGTTIFVSGAKENLLQSCLRAVMDIFPTT